MVVALSSILLIQGALAISKAGLRARGISFLDNWLGDIITEGRLMASNLLLLRYGRLGHGILYTHLVELITMNPAVEGNTLLQAFIKITLPFYVLSIAGIGFYLLFYSGSPGRRAKAKSMLERLTIGLVLISISPQLLKLGLGLSQNVTYQILNTIEVEVFVDIVKEYVHSFSQSYVIVGQLSSTFGMIFPLLWLMYFVWGALAMIAIRYILLTLWIGLFPLTVFFYSFEITRTLGKNMMEQTILWTALQAFNASVIVGVVLAQAPGTSTIPGSENMFVIAHFANYLVFVGAAILILAPLMMTRLFRNFLPG